MNKILEFASKRIKPCPSKVIITPTQTILRILREELSKADQKLTQQQLVADSIALHTCESVSVLGPVPGSAAINLALEPLLCRTIDEVYLLSICAAFGGKFKIGQIVHPDSFISSTEGALKVGKTDSIRILSVDNPYDENFNYFEKFQCSLIDMEAYTVHSLCMKYNKKFTATFCVSDIWNEGDLWNNGFANKDFQDSLRTVVKNLINHLLNLG